MVYAYQSTGCPETSLHCSRSPLAAAAVTTANIVSTRSITDRDVYDTDRESTRPITTWLTNTKFI